MTDEVILSRSALDIAKQWVDAADGPDEEDTPQVSQIQQGAGLGYKPKPKKKEVVEASKLEKMLKKEKRKKDRKEEQEGAKRAKIIAEDAEVEEDTKVKAATSKGPKVQAKSAIDLALEKKRKGKKRKGNQPATGKGEGATAQTKKDPKVAASTGDGSEGDSPQVPPSAEAVDIEGGDAQKPQKKKRKKLLTPFFNKVRSKQKNLRKDTRPEHLKPSYRTPGDPNFVEKKPWFTRKTE